MRLETRPNTGHWLKDKRPCILATAGVSTYMTETEPEKAADKPRSLRGWIGDMPRWKKLSVITATAVMVTGVVLMIADPGTTAAEGGAAGAALQSNLADGQPDSATTAPEPAARGVFRLGFSFISGFALGSFLRAAVRIASIALGFWLAMTIGLAYFELVTVNWEGVDSLWSHFVANIESEWGSFRTFITGSLPAAGLVTVGFAMGIKRH